MSVKARWHTPGTEPVALGDVIDFRDEPALNSSLVDLCVAEGKLDERGIRCPIKGMPDVTCSACPIAHQSSTDPFTALCALGRQQEQTLTELRIVRSR